MRPPAYRARTAGAIALATLATALSPLTADATATDGPVPSPDQRVSVTLVTGDKVHVNGRSVRIEPGPGRKGLVFFRRVHRRELTIVPADAAPLVTAGRLDAGLFNVSRLLRDGYDDRKRRDLPLIVAGAARPSGTRVTRTLGALNGAAVSTRKDQAATFWASVKAGNARVWLDARVRASLDKSVPRIGAPAAWEAGRTGKGVTVGVLDTGIDAGHPDLADAVAASKDFTGNAKGVQDGNGHGTHVASIITGDGVADRRFRGVAPDAKLVVGKVLDDAGNGTMSQLIAGMEWTAGQRLRVVNLSLGVSLPSDGTDPVSAAVNTLTARTGTLFVVASGNAGADESVGAPGLADAALTVGAVDGDDSRAPFSSSGPRPGDGAVKPDITAPGVDIAAARAQGTELGEPVGDRYVRASGTSMATPHVAGAAALIAQANPGWAPARLKAALMNTAKPNDTDTVYRQGAGRVDVGRAVSQRIWTDEGSLSFHVKAKAGKAVTFRNDSSAPVTLDLDLAARNPSGEPAPEGMFEVSPAKIEIPANGTASASVTVDPAKASATGSYSGRLTAGQLTLPVGAFVEPPLHTVTLSGIDRTGQPVGGTVESLPWVGLIDLKTGEYARTFVSGGKVVARVPAGRYGLTAAVNTLAADGTFKDSTLFSRPVLDVDRDITIHADARRGKRVSARLDSRTAVQSGFDEAGVSETVAGNAAIFGIGSDSPAVGLFAEPSAKTTDHPYAFYFVTTRVEPDGPRAYHLALLSQKRIPANPTFRVPDRRLARLDSRYHSDKPLSGRRTTGVVLPGQFFPSGGGEYAVSLPGRRIEFYSPVQNVNWARYLETGESNTGFVENALDPPMSAGRSLRADWNKAAFTTSSRGMRKCARCPMAVTVGPFDSANASWQTKPETQTTVTVHRDGQLLGSADSHTVAVTTPPGRASYSVHATATRQVAWTALGTRSEARWTFPYTPTSKAGEEPPLYSLRATGPFDLDNRAPSGPFQLTVKVVDTRLDTQAHPLPTLRTLTAEVSYDDGRTWHETKVTADGTNRWQAQLVHPTTHQGHVSLRLRASDGDAASAEQTVLRAYGLR
ncbi:S8 family serine peptidase [Actinomadura rudentiformis]|uniref:S8 family serine peptidase n=1 Tax=Actinomadura rudentiformis TaxID=359158 RepID=A0A6H9Z1S4_9ACTN|nr:S8 family serine peptidase [Actinomadura rudentiformis]KAB2350733.1 S8 family serine peptidase [Actinomadura rudentiformis]